jgi:hypothetical protein
MSYPTFLTAVERACRDERERQDAKWGAQNHPDGTGGKFYSLRAEQARRECQRAAADPDVGPRWALILLEEVYEALAETDPDLLRAELIQVATVCQNWAEAIDRRAVLAHPTESEETS